MKLCRASATALSGAVTNFRSEVVVAVLPEPIETTGALYGPWGGVLVCRLRHERLVSFRATS